MTGIGGLNMKIPLILAISVNEQFQCHAQMKEVL